MVNVRSNQPADVGRSPARHPPVRRRLILSVAMAWAVSACGSRLASPPTPSPASGPRPRLLPVAAPATPGVRTDVDFGRAVRLEGVSVAQDVVRPQEQLRLWLHWRSIGESTEDWRSLCELVAPNGRVAAREDDQIGSRRAGLSRWARGERHIDEMRVRMSPNVARGELAIVISVLRPDNQTRVAITAQPSGTTLAREDAILVATIEVA